MGGVIDHAVSRGRAAGCCSIDISRRTNNLSKQKEEKSLHITTQREDEELKKNSLYVDIIIDFCLHHPP